MAQSQIKQTDAKLNSRSAIRYAFMPGILPRIRRLGGIFANFAYVLALIYRSARLLPQGHPMLDPANIGRYGISEVVATAANSLVVKRENTDQILIFGAVIVALIMVVIQIALIILYSFISPASAAPAASSNMFTTATPNEDAVYIFLQQTIGLTNFFNTANPIGFSSGVSTAFHHMLSFYSTAMMIIAVIIVVYYVITVVGESAQTGTPFGKRFNGLWAPVRLVLALGLLVPLGSGLNAAQYLTLQTAKLGSSLASNAWGEFSKSLKDSKNFKIPTNPIGITPIAKQIFMIEVCIATNNQQNEKNPALQMQFRRDDKDSEDITTTYYDAANGVPTNNETTTKFFSLYGGRRIGSPGAGFSCGEIRMNRLDKNGANADYAKSIEKTEAAYDKAIMSLHDKLEPEAVKFAAYTVATKATDRPSPGPGIDSLPTAKSIRAIVQKVDKELATEIYGTEDEFAQAMVKAVTDKTEKMSKFGWGNAATYYMSLAFAGQKIQNIVNQASPTIVTPITAADSVKAAKYGAEADWFQKFIWQTGNQGVSSAAADELAVALTSADKIIKSDDFPDTDAPDFPGRKYITSSYSDDSVFIRMVKKIFSISAMQRLYEGTAAGVFPMILLTNIGTEIIQKAMIAFGAGMIASMIPVAGTAISSMIFLFGFIGIGIGFVLAYLLPFMPFIYFFFAVVEWVMSIIEGLIGAPLWALAHLRIEGEGMPGPGAMNGYIILLGIILRPILIVFGLIASYLIFNSGAYFLNLIFGGSAVVIQDGIELSPLAFVAYLVIYTVICYNLGLVCFKMIDTIPQQSMRWLGQSNLNFNDQKPDPIGNTQQLIVGFGALAGQQTASGFTQAISGTRQGWRESKNSAAAANQQLWDNWDKSGRRGPPPSGSPPSGWTP